MGGAVRWGDMKGRQAEVVRVAGHKGPLVVPELGGGSPGPLWGATELGGVGPLGTRLVQSGGGSRAGPAAPWGPTAQGDGSGQAWAWEASGGRGLPDRPPAQDRDRIPVAQGGLSPAPGSGGEARPPGPPRSRRRAPWPRRWLTKQTRAPALPLRAGGSHTWAVPRLFLVTGTCRAVCRACGRAGGGRGGLRLQAEPQAGPAHLHGPVRGCWGLGGAGQPGPGPGQRQGQGPGPGQGQAARAGQGRHGAVRLAGARWRPTPWRGL